MEEWQKQIIDANLTKLVELTDCSIGLLNRLKQEKVLGREDIEEILACKTALQKSDKLYEIIVKKANSFDIFVKALEDTTQRGVSIMLTTQKNDAKTPALKETHIPKPRKRLHDLDKETTFRLYWKGSELKTKIDANKVLTAASHEMASEVLRSQACNDMLTIIPDFEFGEIDKDELNLKPVTAHAWALKFIRILSNSSNLVGSLNILCNLHKYGQHNYQALIADLFDNLPEVEVREF